LACLNESNHKYCFECQKNEKCEIYQELNHRYDNVPFQNLKKLQEIGEEKWLGEKIKHWTCPGCGAPIEYDQDKCAKCNFLLTIIQD